MSEIESDYSDYQNQRDRDGGPHPGRSDPSRGMLWAAVAVVLLIFAGAAGLALLG